MGRIDQQPLFPGWEEPPAPLQPPPEPPGLSAWKEHQRAVRWAAGGMIRRAYDLLQRAAAQLPWNDPVAEDLDQATLEVRRVLDGMGPPPGDG